MERGDEPVDPSSEMEREEEPVDPPVEMEREEEPVDPPVEMERVDEPVDPPSEMERVEEPVDPPSEMSSSEAVGQGNSEDPLPMDVEPSQPGEASRIPEAVSLPPPKFEFRHGVGGRWKTPNQRIPMHRGAVERLEWALDPIVKSMDVRLYQRISVLQQELLKANVDAARTRVGVGNNPPVKLFEYLGSVCDACHTSEFCLDEFKHLMHDLYIVMARDTTGIPVHIVAAWKGFSIVRAGFGLNAVPFSSLFGRLVKAIRECGEGPLITGYYAYQVLRFYRMHNKLDFQVDLFHALLAKYDPQFEWCLDEKEVFGKKALPAPIQDLNFLAKLYLDNVREPEIRELKVQFQYLKNMPKNDGRMMDIVNAALSVKWPLEGKLAVKRDNIIKYYLKCLYYMDVYRPDHDYPRRPWELKKPRVCDESIAPEVKH